MTKTILIVREGDGEPTIYSREMAQGPFCLVSKQSSSDY